MKNYFKRKIVPFCLAIIMIIGFTFTSSAFSLSDKVKFDDMPIDGIIVTDEVVKEIALSWVASFDPDLELQVGSIIPLIEFNGEKVGYVASYISFDGTPFGYIVLNFSTEGFIDEFVIEEGILGMVESILDNANVTDYLNRIANDIVALHRTLPFEYVVSLESASTALMSTHSNSNDIITKTMYGFRGEMSQEEFIFQTELMIEVIEPGVVTYSTNSASINSTVNHWGDVVITNLPGGGHVIDSGDINGAVSNTQQRALNEAGRYACAVQAMINIAQQRNMLLPGVVVNWGNTYVRLWNDSNTTITQTNPMLGSTPTNMHGDAMASLGDETGRTVTTEPSNSPAFATFQNAVNAGRNSIFSAWVTLHNGTSSGHSVSVVGFRVMRSNTGTQAISNFIRVADGWNAGFRFVNFGDHRFTSRHSSVFTIT
jgi:hypothetical protein